MKFLSKGPRRAQKSLGKSSGVEDFYSNSLQNVWKVQRESRFIIYLHRSSRYISEWGYTKAMQKHWYTFVLSPLRGLRMGLSGLPPSRVDGWSVGFLTGHPSPQTQVMEEVFEICGN